MSFLSLIIYQYYINLNHPSIHPINIWIDPLGCLQFCQEIRTLSVKIAVLHPANIMILEDLFIKPTEVLWADLANSPNPMAGQQHIQKAWMDWSQPWAPAGLGKGHLLPPPPWKMETCFCLICHIRNCMNNPVGELARSLLSFKRLDYRRRTATLSIILSFHLG